MPEQTAYIQGLVLNEETYCTLADLCRMCGVTAELIHDMIDEGILTPQGESPRDWRFTYIAIKRVQTSLRLQHDLRINLPGCGLVLDLLDELEELRGQFRRL